MDRRQFLGWAAATVPATYALAQEDNRSARRWLGIADFSLHNRLRLERQGEVARKVSDPLEFLSYADALGGAGIQASLGDLSGDRLREFRSELQRRQMFLVPAIGLPRRASDVERFEARARVAREAGGRVLRTVLLPGRRYEQFDSREQFDEARKIAEQGLAWAEPIARRLDLKLAIENHKGLRIPEMLELLERLQSEHVGLCVDTGNSISLLEDGMETVEAYAPYALAVHLKDAALAEYPDGFLLADVVLGEGMLDLKRMVEVLRAANPDVLFCLEMATRDPLKVPCLGEKYWATMADMPAPRLAKMLHTVRQQPRLPAAPAIDSLSTEQLIQLEEDNVRRCMEYAKGELV